MGFDLASVLKNVPESGTSDGRERIEYISLSKLHDDPNNFYSLDGIEALAENIEFAGLQQPVRVRHDPENAGEYIIVSGHRRAAAMRKIVEDGNDNFKDAPCIVEAGTGSAALRELRLIYANSDTRRMSSADISKQAERVEALLYQLKEEGVEFPGRMRDHVAEACKVSKSKLSRLKVIRDGLAPDIYAGYYATSSLNESAAYELARLPVEKQRAIVDRATAKKREDIRYLYADVIRLQAGDMERFERMTCPCAGGSCVNIANLTDKLYSSGYRGYSHCADGCCYDCPQLASCSRSCPCMAGAKKAQEAEARIAQAERDAKEEEIFQPTREALQGFWKRMGDAVKAAGVQYSDLCMSAGMYGVEPDKTAAALFRGEGITRDTRMPFGLCLTFRDAKIIIKLADALGVSLDYLFGRDVPESGTGAADAPDPRTGVAEWIDGAPTRPGNYAIRYLPADGKDTEFVDIMRLYSDGTWSEPCITVTAWYPVPRGL